MIFQLLFLILTLSASPVEKAWDTDYYSIYFEKYGEDIFDVIVTEKNGDVSNHRLYLLTGKLFENPEYYFLGGVYVIGDNYGRGSNVLRFYQNLTVFEGEGDMLCYNQMCFDRIFEFHQQSGVHSIKIYDMNGTLIKELNYGTVLFRRPTHIPLFIGIVIDDTWTVAFGYNKYREVEVGIKNGVVGAWVYNVGDISILHPSVYYAFKPGNHPTLAKEIYYYVTGIEPPQSPMASPIVGLIIAIIAVVVLAVAFYINR